MKINQKMMIAALAAGMTLSAHALTITGVNRTGSLDSATAGATATSATDPNLQESTVNNAFSSMKPWTEVGHIDRDTGSLTEGLLSITFTKGTWGGTDVGGTWTIASSFWSTYEDAVIGWHVGNGNGNPDIFMFLVTEGATSGTWSYKRNSGGGGGFSNIQLFGSGEGTTNVPDGGATLALIGLGVAGLGLARRKLS